MSYRRRRPPGGSPLPLFLAAAVILVAAGLGLWYGLRARPPAAAARAEPEPHPAKKPKPPAPRVAPAPPANEPEPPRVLTFEEAWAGAIELGKVLDEAEPEITRKATAVLTGVERLEADAALRGVGVPSENRARLVGLGLAAAAERRSRERAVADPNFRATAAVVWDSEAGARHVLRMMSVWDSLDPDVYALVVVSAANRVATAALPPDARDGFLLLGAGKWLRR